ncbi:MAG: hypothetical protein GF387_00595, partial [Candidatus Portnoybacteria bacterium]|nr:hypothetical protein [Candidatus Portnoybacteria bacterium]
MDDKSLNLYFREIVYQDSSAKKKSVCGVFSHEALNAEDARLGNLYLVGKISNFPAKKHKNYDFLLNILASVIKREFYSNHKRSTLEALESALQSANMYLADFVKRGHDEWIGNMSFTCFAFRKNDIHIARTGDMLIYLFRGNTMTDVTRKFNGQEEKPDPSKTFSNIASGDLEENDKIIVSTANTLDVISRQKIRELISYPGSEQIYSYLKENLDKKSNKEKIDAFAALILEAKSRPIDLGKKKEVKETKEEPVEGFDFEEIVNSKMEVGVNKIKEKVSSSIKDSAFFKYLLDYRVGRYMIGLFIFSLLVLSPYIVQKMGYEQKINKIENLFKRTREAIAKSETSLVYQNQNRASMILQNANDLMANASSLLNKLPEAVRKEPLVDFELIKEQFDVQKNSINNIVNITQAEEIADL